VPRRHWRLVTTCHSLITSGVAMWIGRVYETCKQASPRVHLNRVAWARLANSGRLRR